MCFTLKSQRSCIQLPLQQRTTDNDESEVVDPAFLQEVAIISLKLNDRWKSIQQCEVSREGWLETVRRELDAVAKLGVLIANGGSFSQRQLSMTWFLC